MINISLYAEGKQTYVQSTTLPGHLNQWRHCHVHKAGEHITTTKSVRFFNVISKNEEIKIKKDKHTVTYLPQSEDWAPLTQTHCEMIKVVGDLCLCRGLHTFKVQKKKCQRKCDLSTRKKALRNTVTLLYMSMWLTDWFLVWLRGYPCCRQRKAGE